MRRVTGPCWARDVEVKRRRNGHIDIEACRGKRERNGRGLIDNEISDVRLPRLGGSGARLSRVWGEGDASGGGGRTMEVGRGIELSPLFSDRPVGGRIGNSSAPPPPGAMSSFLDEDAEPVARSVAKKSAGMKFDAELDLCELDERDRPGPTWTGKGRELSRSGMVFRSRRMCYPGRRVLAAVHLIDDMPVPLFGRVASCDYDGDGRASCRSRWSPYH